MDSAAYSGYPIPPYYDSLVGKLIVHGKSRNECLMRLRRALDELVVGGIDTTIPLFQELIKQPEVLDGDYNIHWLENHLAHRGLGQNRDFGMLRPAGLDFGDHYDRGFLKHSTTTSIGRQVHER